MSGNVFSLTSQAAAPDIGPPAFEPGKPWRGLKNIEEDPHATPGSISSNLSISRWGRALYSAPPYASVVVENLRTHGENWTSLKLLCHPAPGPRTRTHFWVRDKPLCQRDSGWLPPARTVPALSLGVWACPLGRTTALPVSGNA